MGHVDRDAIPPQGLQQSFDALADFSKAVIELATGRSELVHVAFDRSEEIEAQALAEDPPVRSVRLRRLDHADTTHPRPNKQVLAHAFKEPLALLGAVA